MDRKNLIIAGVIIGTSLLVISGGIIFWNSRNSPDNASNTTTSTQNSVQLQDGTVCSENDRCFVPSDINTTVSSQITRYNDGSYTTEVVYSVPDGFNRLKLSVKLENGKIVDANVTQSDIDEESRKYDRRFQSAYKSFLLGQEIDSLKLDIVSGASLTSGAFNDALEKIRQQAQS